MCSLLCSYIVQIRLFMHGACLFNTIAFFMVKNKVWGFFIFIITACIVNVFILFHNCNNFGICKYLKIWFIILCTHCSLVFISLVISLSLLEDVLNFLCTRFFSIFTCNYLPESLNRWWFYCYSLFLQEIHCIF